MPYKRAVRVLLVADTGSRWPALGCELGAEIAPGHVELRAMSLPADAGAAAWADLLLTLDAAAHAGLPVLPSRIHVRHLPLDELADDAARRAALLARLRGVTGGLRLLERSASDDRPS